MSAAPAMSHGHDDGALAGYYGLPVIHGPHWKWLIVWYFFFGGISGGAAAIAAIARLGGGPSADRLAKTASSVSLAALLPCPPLLILDLGRPRRFANMLRAFRVSSPMSIGSWALTAFGMSIAAAAAGDAVLASAAGRPLPAASLPRRLVPFVSVASGALGLVVAGYTGPLLAATAVPLWSKRPALLGPLFFSSAMTSATAAVAAAHALRPSGDDGLGDRLHRLEAMATMTEGFLLAAWLWGLGETGRPLREGRLGAVVRHGVVGLGMAAPLGLGALAQTLPRGARRATGVLASALTLCGVLALRYAIVEGGRRSADDPQATFELTA